MSAPDVEARRTTTATAASPAPMRVTTSEPRPATLTIAGQDQPGFPTGHHRRQHRWPTPPAPNSGPKARTTTSSTDNVGRRLNAPQVCRLVTLDSDAQNHPTGCAACARLRPI